MESPLSLCFLFLQYIPIKYRTFSDEPSYEIGSNNHVYNYIGRANLTQFLETAKTVGMFINLRIGPYVCAEYFWGGLPTWLLYDDNVLLRWNNTAWENHMKTFMQEIVRVSTPYLASKGGPIILAQIENEYPHNKNPSYIAWCGKVTTELNIDIPWVMCNGDSAVETINTCNGNDCYDKYLPTHNTDYPGQPLGWTEDEGWYNYWGSATTPSKEYDPDSPGYANRSPEEMAFVIAKWFGGGGCHHNYYMFVQFYIYYRCTYEIYRGSFFCEKVLWRQSYRKYGRIIDCKLVC